METLQRDEKKLEIKENRMWRRMKCDIETQCAAFSYSLPCKIVDLSPRGMGIVSTKNLSQGTVVKLFDSMTKARVVWSKDNRAGLRIIY